MLEKARRYESDGLKQIPEGQKPSFHLCAPVGWINDPNGFSLYKGEYHLFYQYHPYKTVWGPMHWGHSRNRQRKVQEIRQRNIRTWGCGRFVGQPRQVKDPDWIDIELDFSHLKTFLSFVHCTKQYTYQSPTYGEKPSVDSIPAHSTFHS